MVEQKPSAAGGHADFYVNLADSPPVTCRSMFLRNSRLSRSFEFQLDDNSIECSSRMGSHEMATRSLSRTAGQRVHTGSSWQNGIRQHRVIPNGYATLNGRRSRQGGVKLKPFGDEERQSWLGKSMANGFIRVYDAASERSIVVPLTLTSTAAMVCARFGQSPDSMHVELNQHDLRRLHADERPLEMQRQFFYTLGYAAEDDLRPLDDSKTIGHVIKFYAERPINELQLTPAPVSVIAQVRSGAVFKQWTRRLCTLSRSRILIFHENGKQEPDVLPLARCKVEAAEAAKRGHCMKVTVLQQQTYLIAFDSAYDHNMWMQLCTRAASSLSVPGDLSDKQLEKIPEQLYHMGSDRLITELDLRNNRLSSQPADSNEDSIGYLDSLDRFQSLRSLNLSSNKLLDLPLSIFSISSLTCLKLANNGIVELPACIGALKSLSTLILTNNSLYRLPQEITECSSLRQLDLSFNRFTAIPEVLTHLPGLIAFLLAGNMIKSLTVSRSTSRLIAAKNIDLRLNSLSADPFQSIALGVLNHLTHLDVQDNRDVTALDLRSLISLHTLKCQRNRIASLHLCGTSLVNLDASSNEITCIAIIPVPQHLRSFCVSRNRLAKIPEWLAELHYIERIEAAENELQCLPHRLFTNVATLKFVNVHHNQITNLPSQIENCNLEHVDLHHNRLEELPANFLAYTNRLRYLNVSQNFLTTLPPVNSFVDLNKIQHLLLAANQLRDDALFIISHYRRLRVLNLAFNKIAQLDPDCLLRLELLEDLNVSGNRLISLPPTVTALPSLLTLRAHTNHIQRVPDFTGSLSLKVLDLANNLLHITNLSSFYAPQLQHLDLSCNHTQRVDRQPLTTNNTMPCNDSKSRSVHTVPGAQQSKHWQIGFAETNGSRNKLCISQIRQSHSHSSALLGLIDGGHNEAIPQLLKEKLPTILQKQKDGLDLRKALLEAHCIGTTGQKLGASCALALVNYDSASPPTLHVANCGNAQVVLCRRGTCELLTQKHSFGDGPKHNEEEFNRVREAGGVVDETGGINGTAICSRQLGQNFIHPTVIPRPYTASVRLFEHDEFVILASAHFFEYVGCEEAVRRIRLITSPVVAAKHLQDIAQAYGASENLSIIVIRIFCNSAARPPAVPPRPQLSVAEFQSAIELVDSSTSINTLDEVRSEPRGNVIAEKPNYYFEYKKKLREMGEYGSDESLHRYESIGRSSTETISCERYASDDIEIPPEMIVGGNFYENHEQLRLCEDGTDLSWSSSSGLGRSVRDTNTKGLYANVNRLPKKRTLRISDSHEYAN